MTLSELSDLAQVLGAVAVIVSILYLALQIRQNTRALRLSVHHALSDSHSHYNILLAQNSELANLFRTGAADLAALSAEDRHQFDRLLWHVFIQIEDAYYHRQEGALPGPLSERFSKVLPTWLDQPGLRSWFESQKHVMSDDFVRYVQVDVLPRFKQ